MSEISTKAKEGEIKITIHLGDEKNALELSFEVPRIVDYVLDDSQMFDSASRLVQHVGNITEAVDDELLRLLGLKVKAEMLRRKGQL